MKVEITDVAPDVHALHSGHMLMDSFDMIVMAYVAGFIVCTMLLVCTCCRLRRKDPIADAKKSE